MSIKLAIGLEVKPHQQITKIDLFSMLTNHVRFGVKLLEENRDMLNFLFHPAFTFRKWYLIYQTTTYTWSKQSAYATLSNYPDKLPLFEKLYEISRLYDSMWERLAQDHRVWKGVNALYEHNMLTRELVDWLLNKKKFPTDKVIAGFEALRPYTISPEDFFQRYHKYKYIIPVLTDHAPALRWMLSTQLISYRNLDFYLLNKELPEIFLFSHNGVNLRDVLHKYALIKPAEQHMHPQGEWNNLKPFCRHKAIMLLKLESSGLLNEENMSRIHSWYPDLLLLNNVYHDEAEFKHWASLLLDAFTERDLFIKAGAARFSKNLDVLKQDESLSAFLERCHEIEKQAPARKDDYHTLTNLTRVADFNHAFFPPSAPKRLNPEAQGYVIDSHLGPTQPPILR